MTIELTSELVKEYALDAGAEVAGVAASKDFSLAPQGFKPADNMEECVSVIENKKLLIKCFKCRTMCPHCFGY